MCSNRCGRRHTRGRGDAVGQARLQRQAPAQLPGQLLSRLPEAVSRPIFACRSRVDTSRHGIDGVHGGAILHAQREDAPRTIGGSGAGEAPQTRAGCGPRVLTSGRGRAVVGAARRGAEGVAPRRLRLRAAGRGSRPRGRLQHTTSASGEPQVHWQPRTCPPRDWWRCMCRSARAIKAGNSVSSTALHISGDTPSELTGAHESSGGTFWSYRASQQSREPHM